MQIRRKLIFALVALAMSLAFVPSARAVTNEEMDRAKAVAAQWYLRWVNNGSDYLEKLDPKSMADLEKNLKEKEKQNIKAFKSVPVPSDYASWDKDKVVAYWSMTFFESKALDEKGKGARARISKKLKAISFSEPAKAEAPKTAESAQPAPELPSAAAPADTTRKVAEEVPAVPTTEEIIDQTNAEESALAADPSAAEEEAPRKRGGDTSTWIYVAALLVLIGVVVWLVVFASKTMQNSAKASKDLEEEDEERRRQEDRAPAQVRVEVASAYPPALARQEGESSDMALRDKYARKLAVKDDEIRQLQRELTDLRAECMRLGEENGRLTSELSIARREIGTLREQTGPRQVTEIQRPEERREEERPATARQAAGTIAAAETAEAGEVPTRPKEASREIYLGRVNNKGIFVRADRRPVEGKSIYVLTTTDSYTGTYRVLQSSATIDMALDNPEHYLAGGCVAPDITDTEEADGIRTVNSGTAVFEDGCWRVLRKAKIAYE